MREPSTAATTGETDTNTGNNTNVQVQSTVQIVSDLVIQTVQDNPDPVVAGTNLTYTVGILNNGPSVAPNVVVTGQLAAGLSFVSSTFPCSAVGQTVTCNIGALGVGGAPSSGTVTVAVGPSVRGVVNSDLSITSDAVDPTQANNTASASTGVTVQADPVLTISDNPDPVLAGNNLTYTFTVSNTGPSDITAGTSVVVDLPAGVTLVSSNAPSGPCVTLGADLVCGIGAVPNGSSRQVQVTVSLPSSTAQGTVLTVNASLDGAESDTNVANSSAVETTTVAAAADLSVSVTGSPNPLIDLNQPLTYTVTVTNGGPSDATGATVVDTLAAGLTFISATPSSGTCGHAGGVVTCTIGNIAAGATATVTIQASALNVSTDSVQNTAVVSTATTDPNAGNNTATISTSVQARADLSVTKTASTQQPIAGEPLTYTISVSNAGPARATAVVLTDNLPGAVTFVSAQTSQGACAHSNGVVTCQLGNVNSGANATVMLNVDVRRSVLDGEEFTNSVTVSADEDDNVPGNNTAGRTLTASANAVLCRPTPRRGARLRTPSA